MNSKFFIRILNSVIIYLFFIFFLLDIGWWCFQEILNWLNWVMITNSLLVCVIDWHSKFVVVDKNLLSSGRHFTRSDRISICIWLFWYIFVLESNYIRLAFGIDCVDVMMKIFVLEVDKICKVWLDSKSFAVLEIPNRCAVLVGRHSKKLAFEDERDNQSILAMQ